jgi:hypothetical protein
MRSRDERGRVAVLSGMDLIDAGCTFLPFEVT